MDISKRMTMHRAMNLLGDHYGDLMRGLWVDGDLGLCCALGLYLLEKAGDFDAADIQFTNVWRKMADEVGPDPITTVHVVNAIADHVGISREYALGLNNGYEGHSDINFVPDEDFRQGFEDGEELAKYSGDL